MEVKILPPDDAVLTVRDVRRILGSGRDSTPRFPIWSRPPGTRQKLTTGKQLRLWLESVVRAGGLAVTADAVVATDDATPGARRGYSVFPRED